MARITGAIYLFVIVTMVFSLIYVPGQIHLVGDAKAIAQAIVAQESLYRAGILSWVIGEAAFLVLPFAFFRLFHSVQREAAVAMVAFACASVPLGLVAAAHRWDALSFAGDHPPGLSLSGENQQAMMMHALTSYHSVLLVSELFWGLWLLPLGYLVIKCGVLPKIIGLLLMLGCAGYIIELVGTVLFANYDAMPLARFVTLPAAVGEFGICFWLLAMGVRRPAVSGV
ncbi:MAG: DUF4386 domain-containing protein [Methanobacterium sp.]|nr:DUF4386 domain-containing protein [Methanobacterium sp.]